MKAHQRATQRVENMFIILLSLFAGIQNESRKLYGVQFHPEVDLTENGMVMMRNFLYEVSMCHQSFRNQQLCSPLKMKG